MENPTLRAEPNEKPQAKFIVLSPVFDIRTATKAELIERAEYLETFPARGRYRDDLHSEAAGLRALAKATGGAQ